jgi:hypothetical protein
VSSPTPPSVPNTPIDAPEVPEHRSSTPVPNSTQPKTPAPPSAGPPALNSAAPDTSTVSGRPNAPAPNGTGGSSTSRPSQPVKGVDGLRKAYKNEWDRGKRWGDKGAESLAHLAPGFAKGGLKTIGRLAPGIGTAMAAAMMARDLEDGKYMLAAFDVVGLIPGPIGWAGIATSFIYDNLFHHGASYGMWDAPDGTETHMLPGTASGVGHLKEVDAALTDVQRGVFSFQDGPEGTVWNSSPPAPLRLDTPDVQAAVATWLGGIAELFHRVDQILQSSDEPYMAQYRAKLAPHLTAMAKLPSRARAITDQLATASDAAGHSYEAVLNANRAARNQLAGNGSLTDQGPATTLKTKLAQGESAIGAAAQKLTNLFADGPPAVLTSSAGTLTQRRFDPGRNTSVDRPVPTLAAPAATPLASNNGAAKLNDDLNKMLSGLGRNSGMPGGMPLGGGPYGAGLGGGTPPGGSQSAKPAGGGHPLGEDLDRKKLDAKAADKPKLGASRPDNKSVQTHAPAAAAGAAPVIAKPAAAGKPGLKALEDTEVNVKGNKTKFPDAKTAKMAQILASADPNHPVSLADAAAQAGLTAPVPGQDPGQQIAPADAKPGDVLVAGDKRYLMLGDGQFYDLNEYKVVSADQLPKDLGNRAGYFRLGDPTAGQSVGAVSGQTPDAVMFDVPGGRTTPTTPVDTSAAIPAGPTAPARGPVSVSSAGTPGVPRQVAGGPANAAATDTGIGETVPSASTPSLDPGAVK